MGLKKTAAAAEGTAMHFEDAMKRLEDIVEKLESGDLTLEDSIGRYEEGVKLSRQLTKSLDDAEKRIERLVGDDEDEPPTTSPMELELKGEPSDGELPF